MLCKDRELEELLNETLIGENNQEAGKDNPAELFTRLVAELADATPVAFNNQEAGKDKPEWLTRLADELAEATPEAVNREMVLQLAMANDLARQNLELSRYRSQVGATILALMLAREDDPSGN